MSDRNTQLMKAMGSKTGRYDPEPPAQWQWQLDHGTPAERLLAWLKSKTVAFGHGTAYATDENGKALYLDQAAPDLGWSLKMARKTAYAMHAEGRLRLERKARKIWLCADVAPQKPIKEGRIEGELFDPVQTLLPTYVIENIGKLQNGAKEDLVRRYARWSKWSDEAEADALAAVRISIDLAEDIILKHFGIEKKRLAKRPPPRERAVQLPLLEMPDFVQDLPESTLYTEKNGFGQTENGVRANSASLLSSDTDSDCISSSSGVDINSARARTTTTKNKPFPPEETQLLEDELGFDHRAARDLVDECRKLEPNITVARIAELGRYKINQVREKLRSGEITNPVGFLLKSIPRMIRPARAAAGAAS
jgi:hypothetical protein